MDTDCASIPPLPWQAFADAPGMIAALKATGEGFLAYGVHDIDNGLAWRAGDHWFAIIVWDRWRAPLLGQRWVFAKDGAPTWSEPTHFCPISPPEGAGA